jgi:tetratricopeptide (TPR) repeat protein
MSERDPAASDRDADAATRATGGTPGHGTAGAAAEPQFIALRSGAQLRHYVIEEVIGAGGFGITYRARHERLKDKIFAIKEYFPRQFAARSGTRVVSTETGGDTFRWGLDRFLKEAETLARCQHPGIVDVVDYFEENGTAYAVLGYVEGRPLGQWLDALGRPPTQAELDRLLMPLLDALEAVHEARLLHRDIAPDNIMIRRDGQPCLIDFGAAREDVREREAKVSAIVKPGYSPPEQYHAVAELQGPWSDIYALGATLYRAVSGAPPMDASRRGALGDGVRPVAEMTACSGYRPGFLSAVDAALRLQPEERPRSVAAWRDMLMNETPGGAAADAGTGRASQVGAVPPTSAVTTRQAAADDAGPARARPASFTTVAAGSAGSLSALPPRRPRRALMVAGMLGAAVLGLGTVAALRQTSPDAISTTNAARPDPGAATPVAASSDRSVAAVEAARREAAAKAAADEALRREAAERQRQAAAEADRQLQEAAEAARRREIEAREAAQREAAAREATAARAARWQACTTATDTNRFAACAPVVDDATEAAARRAEALVLRGTSRRRTGDIDGAIADLDRALRLVRPTATALNERGIAHSLKRSWPAALADYDAALALEPAHAEALNNRAWVRLQQGNAAAALPDATRSIELVPANAYAYDTRGHIYEALGRTADAIRDYERALALDPAQSASRDALARLRQGR